MIVLATNKWIMRSKLPNNALFKFWSHDQFVSHKNDHEIETLKSIIRQFRPHENRRDQEIESIIRNFDLMIDNLISWKSWISISWNLTSWPWASCTLLYYLCPHCHLNCVSWNSFVMKNFLMQYSISKSVLVLDAPNERFSTYIG
jgi:hypothetical protein